MREAYKVAHTSTFTSSLRRDILRKLFLNLRKDALAFLAGIWICSGQQTIENVQHCGAALYYAASALEANKDTLDPVDFQTMLPSFIVALQSSDITTRKGALWCIRTLVLLSQKRPTSIYGFDTIYGENSGKWPS